MVSTQPGARDVIATLPQPHLPADAGQHEGRPAVSGVGDHVEQDGEAVADDSHDVEKCGAVQLHGRLHCAVRDHVVTSGAHMATYMVHGRISTIIVCGKQTICISSMRLNSTP